MCPQLCRRARYHTSPVKHLPRHLRFAAAGLLCLALAALATTLTACAATPQRAATGPRPAAASPAAPAAPKPAAIEDPRQLAAVSPVELRMILAQIDPLRRRDPAPPGPRRVLYAASVDFLDGWIPLIADASEELPAPGRPYYEATYVGGRIIRLFHVDAAGRGQLLQRIWYNAQGGPILQEMSDQGRVTGLAWGSYDPAGYLARILFLSALGQLRGVAVLQNQPGYQGGVISHFSRDGQLLARTVYQGEQVLSGQPGRETVIAQGSRLTWLSRMTALGLATVYPLPAAPSKK